MNKNPKKESNIKEIGDSAYLIRGALRSPNYTKRKSGWSIDRNGNVEFNDGVFRGDVILGNTVRTVDTAEEIQLAINEVSLAGGGSIYIAPGTYNLTDFVDLPSNVYLIGASRSAVILDFGGEAYGVRAIGTSTAHIVNILIKDLTIQNSSITGLKLQYVDSSLLDGVDVFDCNIGIEWDNVDSTGLLGTGGYCDSNGTNMKITNSTSFSVYFTVLSNSTSGHGLEISDSSSATIFDSGTSDNAGDGINITNCSTIAFVSLSSSGNGQEGVELVAGNSDLQLTDVVASGNTNNGIKLTDTSDRIQLTCCSLLNNGAYGVNILTANCDNNILIGVIGSGNTSGSLSDSGTGTLKSATVNILP